MFRYKNYEHHEIKIEIDKKNFNDIVRPPPFTVYIYKNINENEALPFFKKLYFASFIIFIF
jgi:hypothetical protein